jgi:hypothetical protein
MIRKFYATKDNTITNAFEENLVTRGTGSNMGASDILEVFSIYSQASADSLEKARALIQFDISDRSGIPTSGVSWYLKMFNAPHSQTVPRNFTMAVQAVSQSWEEGYGIDMDYYSDLTKDKEGSNWINRASGSTWDTQGGDYHAAPVLTGSFTTGLEDLEVDVTTLVDEWIAGTKENHGFGIMMSGSYEDGTSGRSFFTKKFFGRDTEFHFQKPVLEARWDSARKDNRGYFYASSSLAPASDNLNTIYLYNRIRGRLRDIPVAPTSASLRATPTGANLVSESVSRVSTGIYKASLALETTASTLYDVWYSGSTAYHTGTISVNSFAGYGYNPEDIYVLSMPGLRKEYRKNQTHRMSLYVREKNWSPNIYTVAVQSSIPSHIIPSASYQLRRSIDDYVVTPYGTGSTNHTGLSYDVSGNYLDLDTTYLEAGYLYEIQYSFYDEENGWEEQPYRFKFRVVD